MVGRERAHLELAVHAFSTQEKRGDVGRMMRPTSLLESEAEDG